MAVPPKETLDVALLPLADGRHVMLPLEVLAEVQQLAPVQQAEGEAEQLSWRGHELPIESLDSFCGLPVPARERLTTVGIVKAHQNSEQPFRALAFAGTASNIRISAESMTAQELPAEGHFAGATQVNEQTYLIPDLPKLLFATS